MLAAGIGWAAGCDAAPPVTSSTPTVPCAVEELGEGPTLQLGTGVDAFVPVNDGDEVLIVFGPQGGYHLDGSLRVSGINAGNADDLSDPDNPLTTFRVLRANGDPVSGVEGDDVIDYRQGIDPTCRDGVHEMVGRRIFLDIVSDAVLDGENLTVTVTVEDVDGVSLEDTHELLAVPSPFN